MKKDKGYLKYFEFTVGEARDWSWRDWVLFVIESFYQTIFPFVAGMLLVKRNEVIWLFMMILPIYFRLRIQKKESGEHKKRIYVKD